MRPQLRGLAESADQLFEQVVLRFRLACLMTRAQDCHGWAFKIGLNGPLVEIQEGDEGEAICPRGWLRLYKSGSMRSFLDTETNRKRGRGGSESQTGSLDKVQSWPNLGVLERAGILKYVPVWRRCEGSRKRRPNYACFGGHFN